MMDVGTSYQEPWMSACKSNRSDGLLRFAEILYRCRLCTVLPCTTSSKCNFLLHMHSTHTTTCDKKQLYPCSRCELKFAMQEDLLTHMRVCHPLSNDVQKDCSAHMTAPSTLDNQPAEISNMDTSQSIERHIDTSISTEVNGEQRAASPIKRATFHMLPRLHDQSAASSHVDVGLSGMKYASTILINGQTYNYCQVCLYKTKNRDDFSIHFQTRQHHKVVEELERPQTTGTLSAGGVIKTPSKTAVMKVQPTAVTPVTNESGISNNKRKSSTSPKSKRKRTVPVACRPTEYEVQVSDSSLDDTDMDVFGSDLIKTSSTPIVASMDGRLNTGDCCAVDTNQSPIADDQLSSMASGNPDKMESQDYTGIRASQDGDRRCLYCDYCYVDLDDYSRHYTETHLNSIDVKSEPPDGVQFFGESYVIKADKIMQRLPELLCECSNGCVPRSLVLDKLAEELGYTDVSSWAPACNKAVRDLFPNSQALRKGKFKKTFFFGVRFSNPVLNFAAQRHDTSEGEDPNYLPMPLRDMGRDTRTLLQMLPELISFTGKMESCVTRDSLLALVSERLSDSDVTSWGMQCNRAVRHLFPNTYLKRKGKYKTTCYFGIQLLQDVLPSVCGPPVVDVRDMVDADQSDTWGEDIYAALDIPQSNSSMPDLSIVKSEPL